MKKSKEWAQYSSSFVYFIVLVCLVRASDERTIDISDVAPSDYDYLHPPKEGNESVPVNVSISKINIRNIDESHMSFSLTIEMWQSWTDFRLNYPSWAHAESSILDSSWINKIWNPKLYFRNAIDGKLDNIITPSSFFWLRNNKRVYYCCRVILTLICEMDLKYFPHDKQECGIEMSSSVYSGLDMILQWSSTARLPHMVSLQQYELKSVNYYNYTVPFGRNVIHCLRMSVVLNRRTGYYLINVYIPTILIVIMSMLTFWIPPDAVPARVTLGVTSLLTIITKQYQASMPNVSYIVALNVWLSSCIAFVFFSLLEFAAVIALSSNVKKSDKVPHNHHHHPDFLLPMVTLRSNGTWTTNRPVDDRWAKKSRQNVTPKENLAPKENLKPRRLDIFSRIFFPSSFIVFAIIYWQIYDS